MYDWESWRFWVGLVSYLNLHVFTALKVANDNPEEKKSSERKFHNKQASYYVTEWTPPSS